jgi:hypothetical protein
MNNYYNKLNDSSYELLDIQDILKNIKQGEWKDLIEELRINLRNGEEERAGELKKNLPCFTISGMFKGRRKKANLSQYSNLIGLDYDKVDNPEALRDTFKELPYTYCAFISPSGNGLKVFVKTDNKLEAHRKAFNVIREVYDNYCGVESDKNVKDITRLCFVSYDPDLYFNEDAEVFKFTTSSKSPEWVWSFTSNVFTFHKGSRNEFIHLFGCNANRHGLDIQDTIDFALSYSEEGFGEDEIRTTINSAYNGNLEQHGMYSTGDISAFSAISTTDVRTAYDSPYIPEEVYENLPPILQEACSEFTDLRQRDMFLTSSLSTFGAGFFNVWGLYDGDVEYTNIFCFIIAPPASGKRCIKYSKQLGITYHEKLRQQYSAEFEQYTKEKIVYDKKVKNAKSIADLENVNPPEEPKIRVFFIPGDITKAALVKLLESNDGVGLINESEADTLTGALNSQHGGFSSLLRAAYEHEQVSSSRVTDNQYSDVSHIRLSMAVSGTPDQLKPLVGSVNNGLFSRFLFYTFDSDFKWRKTFTSSFKKSKKEIFDAYSDRLLEKFERQEQQQFQMTEKQGLELDRRMERILEDYNIQMDNPKDGVIPRGGNVVYRIAMILSAIRSDEAVITCTDEDFETAFTLYSKVYLPHSIIVRDSFSQNFLFLNENEQKLFEWMEQKSRFKRLDFQKEIDKLGISKRTGSNILSRFLSGELLVKQSHGVYRVKR